MNNIIKNYAYDYKDKKMSEKELGDMLYSFLEEILKDFKEQLNNKERKIK